MPERPPGISSSAHRYEVERSKTLNLVRNVGNAIPTPSETTAASREGSQTAEVEKRMEKMPERPKPRPNYRGSTTLDRQALNVLLERSKTSHSSFNAAARQDDSPTEGPRGGLPPSADPGTHQLPSASPSTQSSLPLAARVITSSPLGEQSLSPETSPRYGTSEPFKSSKKTKKKKETSKQQPAAHIANKMDSIRVSDGDNSRPKRFHKPPKNYVQEEMTRRAIYEEQKKGKK